MTTRKLKTPFYCHHKDTGQAVVRINGEDRYLGKYESPESWEEYSRLLSDWLTTPHPAARRKAHGGMCQ